MRRRSFLLGAGAVALSPVWRGAAQISLGTLAWIDGGGLWIRELPDGLAVNIVSGMGFHAPRFSASGRWLTYKNRDEKLSVVRSDGQAGASFEEEDAIWLPSEDRLAILRDDHVIVLGSNDSWKMATQSPAAALPCFSPGGDRYVFAREVPGAADADPDAGPAAGQICVASLSDPHREPEVLVSNPAGALQPYRWTRDGKSVVFWRADEWSASLWCDGVALQSVSAAGGAIRSLGVSVLAHEDVLELAPTPAGNRIAVTAGEGRETWAGKQIALIDLENGSRQNLTDEDVAANGPAWSPDGRRIAFVAGPDAAVEARKSNRLPPAGGEEAHASLQKRKIWELDSNGANEPRQLTGDSRYRDEEPMWSADGSHLLFGRMDFDGHASLWMMDGSGGATKRVCGLKIFNPFDNEDSWFGFYGYTDWHDAFDWRRPAE